MSRIAYHIDDLLPGAKLQATGNADRGLCALTAAAASWVRGQQLRGELTGVGDDQVDHMLDVCLQSLSVPQKRFERWVRAVNGERLGHSHTVYPIQHEDGTIRRADAYQWTGIEKLTVAGGVMAFDIGLGKTITAITAALEYRYRIVHINLPPSVIAQPRLWIICPLIAMGAWKPYLPYLRLYFSDVQLISVDSAHKCVAAPSAPGGILIVDEVHAVGDSDARRTKALHAIRPLFDVCIALTGTLLHAGIEKVLSMQDVAVPGAALFANRWSAGEYFSCLVKQKLGGRTVTNLVKPVGANKQRFLDYISRIGVINSRDAADVKACIDIPPQTLTTIQVCEPFQPLHQDVVAAVEAIVAAGGELPHASAIRHQLARAHPDEKIAAWWKLVEVDSEPWVAFAHYRDTLDLLEQFLIAIGQGSNYVRVDGDTPPAARQLAQQRFQAGEIRFFIGQMTAAGQSIDLFRAHKSVAFDSAWKAIDYAQALGRTQRRGQLQACEHIDFVANRLQLAIVECLREARDFNAEAAAYQQVNVGVPTP